MQTHSFFTACTRRVGLGPRTPTARSRIEDKASLGVSFSSSLSCFHDFMAIKNQLVAWYLASLRCTIAVLLQINTLANTWHLHKSDVMQLFAKKIKSPITACVVFFPPKNVSNKWKYYTKTQVLALLMLDSANPVYKILNNLHLTWTIIAAHSMNFTQITRESIFFETHIIQMWSEQPHHYRTNQF